MKRPLPERAIDHAFTMHIDGLFEKFNAAIKVQSADGRGLDHACNEFANDFAHARTTHREMMKHLETISDQDL